MASRTIHTCDNCGCDFGDFADGGVHPKLFVVKVGVFHGHPIAEAAGESSMVCEGCLLRAGRGSLPLLAHMLASLGRLPSPESAIRMPEGSAFYSDDSDEVTP